MYYCEKCRRYVTGDSIDSEPRCELCGNDDLEEAKKCEVCGDWTTERYCDWCKDDAVSAVRRFVTMTKGNPYDLLDLLADACNDEWVRLKQEGLKKGAKNEYI